MAPARFAVLSMFHIFRGFCRGLFPSFIRCMKFSLMKQSVAPESTSAFVSAIALLVLIETGTCMDRNRVVTITELNLWTALTQADGFRRFENPLFQRGPSSRVLARLLPPSLLLGAMNWLVAAGFEWLIVLLLVVLLHHRIRSCRRLLLHALDLGVGSNFFDCWICSMCAGDSCDSDVPFCDMCSTQLRVGPSAFRLLFPFEGNLLVGRMCYWSLMPGLFLRSRLRVLVFVLRMCPLHLDRLASSEASTFWVVILLLPRDVL